MITKYLNYALKFNGFFSRDKSPRIKTREYANSLYEKRSKGTHWVSLVIDRNAALYFDSFGF